MLSTQRIITRTCSSTTCSSLAGEHCRPRWYLPLFSGSCGAWEVWLSPSVSRFVSWSRKAWSSPQCSSKISWSWSSSIGTCSPLSLGRPRWCNITSTPHCHQARCLGSCIGRSLLKPQERCAEAMHYYPCTETKKQVCTFLAQARFYPRFVSNFALVSAPSQI